MTDHPITPPHYLIMDWCKQRACINEPGPIHVWLATQAAQWGADQELQACINFVYNNELCDPDFYKNLSKHRRPKPPSLKKQALDAVAELEGFKGVDTIRKALEALPND